MALTMEEVKNLIGRIMDSTNNKKVHKVLSCYNPKYWGDGSGWFQDFLIKLDQLVTKKGGRLSSKDFDLCYYDTEGWDHFISVRIRLSNKHYYCGSEVGFSSSVGSAFGMIQV